MRRRKNDLTKNMKKIQNKDTNHINFIQTEFDGGMMELLLKQFNVKTIYFHVILVKKLSIFKSQSYIAKRKKKRERKRKNKSE